MEPTPDAARRTVVKLSGHSTVIKGYGVSEIVHMVTEARGDGHDFLFIQQTQFGDNGIAIDPSKVEGVYAADRG